MLHYPPPGSMFLSSPPPGGGGFAGGGRDAGQSSLRPAPGDGLRDGVARGIDPYKSAPDFESGGAAEPGHAAGAGIGAMDCRLLLLPARSEEHTSELQSRFG